MTCNRNLLLPISSKFRICRYKDQPKCWDHLQHLLGVCTSCFLKGDLLQAFCNTSRSNITLPVTDTFTCWGKLAGLDIEMKASVHVHPCIIWWHIMLVSTSAPGSSIVFLVLNQGMEKYLLKTHTQLQWFKFMLVEEVAPLFIPQPWVHLLHSSKQILQNYASKLWIQQDG